MPKFINEPPKPSKKLGRPEAEIDLKIVEAFAQFNCSDTDIALAMGVSRNSIARVKKKKVYQAAIERGRAHTRMNIKKALIAKVMKGDMTAIIWADKTINGVSEYGGAAIDSISEIKLTIKRPKKPE